MVSTRIAITVAFVAAALTQAAPIPADKLESRQWQLAAMGAAPILGDIFGNTVTKPQNTQQTQQTNDYGMHANSGYYQKGDNGNDVSRRDLGAEAYLEARAGLGQFMNGAGGDAAMMGIGMLGSMGMGGFGSGSGSMPDTTTQEQYTTDQSVHQNQSGYTKGRNGNVVHRRADEPKDAAPKDEAKPTSSAPAPSSAAPKDAKPTSSAPAPSSAAPKDTAAPKGAPKDTAKPSSAATPAPSSAAPKASASSSSSAPAPTQSKSKKNGNISASGANTGDNEGMITPQCIVYNVTYEDSDDGPEHEWKAAKTQTESKSWEAAPTQSPASSSQDWNKSQKDQGQSVQHQGQSEQPHPSSSTNAWKPTESASAHKAQETQQGQQGQYSQQDQQGSSQAPKATGQAGQNGQEQNKQGEQGQGQAGQNGQYQRRGHVQQTQGGDFICNGGSGSMSGADNRGQWGRRSLRASSGSSSSGTHVLRRMLADDRENVLAARAGGAGGFTLQSTCTVRQGGADANPSDVFAYKYSGDCGKSLVNGQPITLALQPL